MQPKKILILTASHLCRNPRVVKEATTLGAAGYEVTVMTLSVHQRFEKLDQDLVAPLPFRRVVLDYSSANFRSQLVDFCQRGATWAARFACREWGFESAQSLGPAWALLHFARTMPADLTIVHTEIPIWAAQHLIRDGRKVAVDVEDWYSEDLLFADRQSRPIRLLQEAEAHALGQCAYSSTTSASMSRALAERYGCPAPLVIRNTFPLQPRCRLDAPPATEPAMIWFSQTIGPGRGLELFFAAWARTTSPSRVYLLGDERPGYREKLLRRLPPERRGRVHFLPLVTPEELPLRLAEFDLGLALEPLFPLNRNLTITNKIFQYMNAGLAVIATDTSGQREVMDAAPASGVVVEAHETADFAGQLDRLLGDRERLRHAQEMARAAAVGQFCWEKDAPVLLRAVAHALT
jgi:glycosyltransferase involved in cell wall biosynthesis